MRGLCNVALAGIVLACFGPAIPQLAAQEASGRGHGIAIGGSIGSFGFLNGRTLGASFQLASRLPSNSLALEIWAATPPRAGYSLIGFDVAGIGSTGGEPALYIKAGVGILVSGELTGPGANLGLGVLVRDGRLGIRLEATVRAYTPGGGVPVTSVTLGFMRLGASN